VKGQIELKSPRQAFDNSISDFNMTYFLALPHSFAATPI